MDKGVDVRDIEGGYEWNGWHLYQRLEKEKLGSFTPIWAPWYVKDVSPGHAMKYIISFSSLGGYEIIDQEKVKGIFSNINYIYACEVRPDSI